MKSKGPIDLVFISYESGDFSSCPAEWADDKALAFENLGIRSILITNLGSAATSTSNQRIVKIPSISHSDFKDEIVRCKRHRKTSWIGLLYGLVPASIGRLFDFTFAKLAGNLGWGRWSWTINASVTAIWLLLMNPKARLFASGGPSSAHLAAVIAGRLTHRPVNLEFQDPFVGSEMSMSQLAWKVLKRLEKFLIANSAKTAFVTNKASEEVRARFPEFSPKITGLYPGAPFFSLDDKLDPPWPTGRLVLLHLGTLYGDRNLKFIFESLDSIYEQDPKLRNRFLVVNLGNIYLEELEEYKAREDFLSLSPVPRLVALALAKKADCLLLIQHVDSRSVATIPYKTYDYLNLGKPIIGLLNNEELAELIRRHGGVAVRNTDLDGITSALLQLNQGNTQIPESGEIILQRAQVQKLLDLA